MDTITSPAIVTISPPPPEPVFVTREAWLASVAATLRPRFEACGGTLPERIRFSCGFPGGRAADSTKHIGQCWYPAASADHTIEVFVSPVLGNALEAAATLVHELVHACLDMEAGHGPKFRKLAIAIGLEGKMTATVPGQALIQDLLEIIALVGPYPHAQLRQGEAADKPKKQVSRQRKVFCPDCGGEGDNAYIVRMSQKCINRGLPACGACGARMVPEGSEEEEGDGE